MSVGFGGACILARTSSGRVSAILEESTRSDRLLCKRRHLTVDELEQVGSASCLLDPLHHRLGHCSDVAVHGVLANVTC